MIERANGLDGVRILFLPNALMSIANYDFLRNKLTVPELSYFELQEYLVNFPESIDPARSSFIVKEWEAVKEGNVLRKPRACSIIATVNNNLLIVEKKHEEQELGKVKNPLQMRLTKVDGVEPGHDGYGTTVNVVERRPGTLFTHKTKAKLRFETIEEASQFLQYVNNQIASEIIPGVNQSGFIGGENNQLGMAASEFVNNQGGLAGQQYIPMNNQVGMTSGQYIPVTNQSTLVGSQVYPVNATQYSQVGGQFSQVGGQLSPMSNQVGGQFIQMGGQLSPMSNQQGLMNNQIGQISGEL